MVNDVDFGPMWDSTNRTWISRYERLPVTPQGRLLLVPKAIVRQHLEYDAGEYYRHFFAHTNARGRNRRKLRPGAIAEERRSAGYEKISKGKIWRNQKTINPPTLKPSWGLNFLPKNQRTETPPTPPPPKRSPSSKISPVPTGRSCWTFLNASPATKMQIDTRKPSRRYSRQSSTRDSRMS